MIVQLTGLPGTGKSTLAAGLRHHFGERCLVLEKDRVRAALYGQTGQVAYCRKQDDFVVALLHLAARDWLAHDPSAVVVLERTGTRAYQIADVTRLAKTTNQPLAVIRCWCPDDVAHARLDADHRDGQHPSANRTFDLYQRLQRTADPTTVPALHLRTDRAAADVVVAAVDYLNRLLDTDRSCPVDG